MHTGMLSSMQPAKSTIAQAELSTLVPVNDKLQLYIFDHQGLVIVAILACMARVRAACLRAQQEAGRPDESRGRRVMRVGYTHPGKHNEGLYDRGQRRGGGGCGHVTRGDARR
jgi:hypothetical protein